MIPKSWMNPGITNRRCGVRIYDRNITKWNDQCLKSPESAPNQWKWTLKGFDLQGMEASKDWTGMFLWNVPLTLCKSTNPEHCPALSQKVEPPSPQTGSSATSRCASLHGCSGCTLQGEGDTSEIFDTKLREETVWGALEEKWNHIDLPVWEGGRGELWLFSEWPQGELDSFPLKMLQCM